MATLTVQTPGEDGGLTLGAAATGLADEFLNASGENTYFVVNNGGGSACVVTITAQDTSTDKSGYGTVTKADGGGSVAAGAVDVFGPFPDQAFNNANGRVEVTYDQVASVTVAAFTK